MRGLLPWHGPRNEAADLAGDPLALDDAEARTQRAMEAIVAYLARSPMAADTEQGIVQWWLPAMGVDVSQDDVSAAAMAAGPHHAWRVGRSPPKRCSTRSGALPRPSRHCGTRASTSVRARAPTRFCRNGLRTSLRTPISNAYAMPSWRGAGPTGSFEEQLDAARRMAREVLQTSVDLQRADRWLAAHSLTGHVLGGNLNIANDAQVRVAAEQEMRLLSVLRFDRFTREP